MSEPRFTSFPLTEPPPHFVASIMAAFSKHAKQIGTAQARTGLKSDDVLGIIRDDLLDLGFQIELSKRKDDQIPRPVFFGENGAPTLEYKIDAYHREWRCGLEIEAGRAWQGNAIYRDIVQALVMVDVDFLVLAVPQSYRYNNKDKEAENPAYDQTVKVASAVWGHQRVRMPYKLTVIGY